MSFYRITLKRSTISLPKQYKDTVAKLGLKKTGSVAYQKINPISAGMILKVKELVQVELVDKTKTAYEERLERKSDPGFTIEKSV